MTDIYKTPGVVLRSDRMNTAGFLRCPHCRSTILEYLPCRQRDGDILIAVVCRGCGATGPIGLDKAEAKANWNERQG